MRNLPAARRWFALVLPAVLLTQAALADDPFPDDAFHDVEREALLLQTQIDAAAPEPPSFTALGIAPFRTAQALSPADLSFAATQDFDGAGQRRTSLAIDFSSLTLLRSRPWALSDYKGHHDNRTVARAQGSLAASFGSGSGDAALYLVPAVRVVLHQERDPRVHRGPGSLEDCFRRDVPMPPGRREAIAELGRSLDAAEERMEGPTPDVASRVQAFEDWQKLESRWEDAVDDYRHALLDTIDKGMTACREDREMSDFAWNSTGYAVGAAPLFRGPDGTLHDLALHGYTAWATASWGFDARGRMRDWSPGFFGRHAQVLGQLTLRRDVLLPRPGASGVFDEANQHVVSVRLRGGTSPLNASLEFALLHDDFEHGIDDTYTAWSIGADMRVLPGTWMNASIARTFARERIPDRTAVRISLQRSVF